MSALSPSEKKPTFQLSLSRLCHEMGWKRSNEVSCSEGLPHNVDRIREIPSKPTKNTTRNTPLCCANAATARRVPRDTRLHREQPRRAPFPRRPAVYDYSAAGLDGTGCKERSPDSRRPLRTELPIATEPACEPPRRDNGAYPSAPDRICDHTYVRRRRSGSVTSSRFGSLPRRIRFSSFRN